MPEPLRPLSTGELLDRTFGFYRARFRHVIAITLLPYLALFALQVAVELPLMRSMFGGLAAGRLPHPALLRVFGSDIVNSLGAMVAVSLATGAIVLSVAAAIVGAGIGAGAALRSVLHRLGGLLGLLTLIVLLAMAWMLPFLALVGAGFALNRIAGAAATLLAVPCCLAAGVLVLLRYGVAVPALLTENVSARAAMKRSARLTQGFRVRVLLVFVMYYAVLLCVNGLFGAVLLAVGLGGGVIHFVRLAASGALVTGLITGVLVSPILAIALSLLYFDLRVRKEAFDLEMLLGRAQGSTPAPA